MEKEHEVEVLSVIKKFGSVIAVDSVSLGVRRGEFLTLLGPSGCGKTTLLRIIAGFESPDSGRVILGESDVTALPPYRRDVTTVFQHYALFPHINVFGNVAFGLERRRVARDEIKRRVAEALDMVRLNGLEQRMPDQLSGGQQQRVALARALVLEPRVLLLDEPLAALDLKLRKQMQVELKCLQRRLGISFIYVTHDQEEALTMSDRIVVMNAGRVEQAGDAEEIYERPRTRFVADFVGLSNIFEGVIEQVRGAVSIVRVGEAKLPVKSDGAKQGERVRLMIRPEKINFSPGHAECLLAGRVDSAVYLGDSTQWKVLVAGGKEVTVLEQNRDAARVIQNRLGKEVGLSWDSESAVILRD